jgi:MHS family proline/betaine transporter-like MFS transporter
MSTEVVIETALRNEAEAASHAKKAIAAGVWGTVVEWYDYAVYGFLATIIAQAFFPSKDETTALLSAFAAFGVGFVARPLGGIVIGRLGDVYGRKAALILSLLLMAISTVGIGLIPTYQAIGIVAPALLVLCRIVQGFSAGGEWGGATAFMVEWAPSNKRGFYGSLQQASVAGGLLIGSGAAASVATILTTDQLNNWGWRIPFLLGGVLLPLGLYIRRNIEDTPAFRQLKERKPASREVPWRAAVQAFGFTILWTVSFYMMLSYMPTFTQKYVGLARSEALWSNTIGLLVIVAAIPLMGLVSDRIGRKPMILTSVLSFLVLSYPLFLALLTYANLTVAILVQVIFALMLATFSGPGPAAIAEIFPTDGRSTWMSTAYSLSVAIFGGFAPYIATLLISSTGSSLAPTFYLIAAAAISTIAVISLKETAHTELM